MDMCLCEGADVDEEVKEALEKGYNRLRRCIAPPPLKRFMPRRLFNLLQFRTTPLGATLLDVVRVGLYHFDVEIGLYAPDQYAYDSYKMLFDRIFEDRHGFHPHQIHPKSNWGDWDRITDLDPENKYIISTRVRCARNLDGFRFSPTMSPVDFETVESVIVQMLQLLPWEYSGQYIPMQSMSDEIIKKLIDHHLFFVQGNEHERAGNISRFWPMGRGVFFNHNYTFAVWVNEKDHLRAVSIEPGGNLREAYRRIAVVMPVLDKRLPPADHDRLGFLTVCPGNLGSALRLSVVIHMPNAPWEQIVKVAKVYRLEVDEIEKQVFCISNKRSLGYSEYDVAMQFIHGTREMIKLQMTHEAKGTVIPDSDDSQEAELQDSHAGKNVLMQKLLDALGGTPMTGDHSNKRPSVSPKGRALSPRKIAGAMSAEIEFRKRKKMSISKMVSPDNSKTAGGDTLREKRKASPRTSTDSRTGKQSSLRGTKSAEREPGQDLARKDGGTVSPLRGVESTPVSIKVSSVQSIGTLSGSRLSVQKTVDKTSASPISSDHKNQLSPRRSIDKGRPQLSPQRRTANKPVSQQKSPDRGNKPGSHQKSREGSIIQVSQRNITSYESELDASRETSDDTGRQPNQKLQMSSKSVRGSLVKIPSIRSTRASTRADKKSMVDFINPEKKKERKYKKNWKQMLWI